MSVQEFTFHSLCEASFTYTIKPLLEDDFIVWYAKTYNGNKPRELVWEIVEPLMENDSRAVLRLCYQIIDDDKTYEPSNEHPKFCSNTVQNLTGEFTVHNPATCKKFVYTDPSLLQYRAENPSTEQVPFVKNGVFWVSNGKNLHVSVKLKPRNNKPTFEYKWKTNPEIERIIVEQLELMKSAPKNKTKEENTSDVTKEIKKKFTAAELLARNTNVPRKFEFVNLKEINPFTGRPNDE